MVRKYLEDAIVAGKSTREIAKEAKCSQCKVRYWLKCYGLRTLCSNTGVRRPHRRACVLCNKPTSRGCRLCAGCQTKVRRYRTKLAAVNLLGGKCARCGWAGPAAGFEFHHTGVKDFTIGQAANKSWSVVKAEVLRCTLLCSCCHRILHADKLDGKLAAEVANYKGTLLI